MRLWMLSGTTVAAATAMGLTLGSYAVSPQRSPLERDAEPSLYTDFEAPVADAADPGPRTIHCTGCGPTLADRRHAAAMAGYDDYGMVDGGSSDPVVQDYLAAADADMGYAATPVEAPVPVIHQLPPNVVRFADAPSPAARPHQAVAPAQESAQAPGQASRPAMRVALTEPAASPAARATAPGAATTGAY